MSQLQSLKVFVNQKLNEALEEIFIQFDKTISEYEDKMQRQSKILEMILKPEVRLKRADVHQLPVVKQEVPSLEQEEADSPIMMEEQEEVWTNQEGEQHQPIEDAEFTNFLFTVKSENNQDDTQFHQTQTEHGVDSETSDSFCLRPQTHINQQTEYAGCKHPVSKNNIHKGFKCSICGKRFRSKAYLKAHTRAHTGERPFKCSVCKKSFSWNARLYQHMKIHTGEKPFICSVCGKGFIESGNMKVHMRIHTGEKPYTCSVCGKKYSQQGNLKQHMACHKGEKIFSCRLCDKRFIWQCQLRNHTCSANSPYCQTPAVTDQAELLSNSSATVRIKTEPDEDVYGRSQAAKTSDPTSDGRLLYYQSVTDYGTSECNLTNNANRDKAGRRQFNCSMCRKSFQSNACLIAHVRCHTGEKPFCCSICQKGFSQSGRLRMHMRTHTGERPFSCSVCGKGFSESGNMKVHMRIHTGEKPYVCPICGKEYRQSGGLKRHLDFHKEQQ